LVSRIANNAIVVRIATTIRYTPSRN
jgi:hypothetical protein